VIDSIHGEVVRVGTDHVVLDTGGIAYVAFCSAGTLRDCHEGQSVLIYIHLIVREDTIQLYGFGDSSEREIFRHLLTVGQVGPKLALQVLSALPPGALVEAITSNDVSRLTAIKGIGRKTAERILVDLRDRVGDVPTRGAGIFLTPDEETALKALTSKALGSEELVRRSLELLGSAR
jgi:Holliday junction DNA helicase RuvA